MKQPDSAYHRNRRIERLVNMALLLVAGIAILGTALLVLKGPMGS